MSLSLALLATLALTCALTGPIAALYLGLRLRGRG
jgi:hypothetical protein